MMQTTFRLGTPSKKISISPTPRSSVSVAVRAVRRATGVTVSDVKNADGGRMVVEVDGEKVLLAAVGDEVCAVSNKCAHMGISLVGKTALLQGEVSGGCITCPAHGTKFDLKTGEPQGEWCPKLPELPFVGKIGNKRCNQPTFVTSVDETGAVSIDL